MTWTQAYTSLKQFYKKLLLGNPYKWTLSEIDKMDVHFFYDVLETEDPEPQEQDEEVYLSDIW